MQYKECVLGLGDTTRGGMQWPKCTGRLVVCVRGDKSTPTRALLLPSPQLIAVSLARLVKYHPPPFLCPFWGRLALLPTPQESLITI